MTIGHPPTAALGHTATHRIMKALAMLDPKAAAINVGSENPHLSIACDTNKVRGTFAGDLGELRDWFKTQDVRTMVLEATSVYWLCLYEVLEASGLEVVVNGLK